MVFILLVSDLKHKMVLRESVVVAWPYSCIFCRVLTVSLFQERGVVWEETLILLPDNVHYVFLSATIPNARQFCEWVCHLHHQPCHVVYTDYRPVPLQHFLFPAGGEGIHLIVDEKVNFCHGLIKLPN